MLLIKTFLIMLVIVSCQETQNWQEIEINKTVKIKSEIFVSDNTNYIFNWSKPIGNNEGIDYIIQYDKILVKGKKIGQYKIDLSIENISNDIIHQETFYINVIPDKSDNSNLLKESTKEDNSEISSNKKSIKKKNANRYTIQVASWPDVDKALEDKNKLISLGYDAYIEKYSNKEKNILRWRVRIGSFEDKKLASKVKEELSEFRGKDIWIDKIK